MGIFAKKASAPALKTGPYVGDVAFSNGAHYPVTNDGGHDETQRLLWDAETETYNWAKPEDPTHSHLYELAVVEVPVAPTQTIE